MVKIYVLKIKRYSKLSNGFNTFCISNKTKLDQKLALFLHKYNLLHIKMFCIIILNANVTKVHQIHLPQPLRERANYFKIANQIGYDVSNKKHSSRVSAKKKERKTMARIKSLNYVCKSTCRQRHRSGVNGFAMIGNQQRQSHGANGFHKVYLSSCTKPTNINHYALSLSMGYAKYVYYIKHHSCCIDSFFFILFLF